jgi:hypothetical protein
MSGNVQKMGQFADLFPQGIECTKEYKVRSSYHHFDKLLFLLPCIENRPTEGNLAPTGHPEEEEDDDEDVNESFTSSSTPIV